ncbi:MAG: hypothetical protein JWM93_1838 [Frankiales bacterium]|nr:hypothetical protein [Frankiales bacterium]
MTTVATHIDLTNLPTQGGLSIERSGSAAIPEQEILFLPKTGTPFHLTTILPPELMDEAWELYLAAFNPLRTIAVQRHVMYRSEFEDEMNDARITKFLAFDGDLLTSLAVRTADLAAVPLVSAEYFEARYPAEYAEKSIHYCMFFAILPDYQRSGALIELMKALAMRMQDSGVLVCDIAAARVAVHMDKAIARMLMREKPSVTTVELDAQTYIAYEFGPAR